MLTLRSVALNLRSICAHFALLTSALLYPFAHISTFTRFIEAYFFCEYTWVYQTRAKATCYISLHISQLKSREIIAIRIRKQSDNHSPTAVLFSNHRTFKVLKLKPREEVFRIRKQSDIHLPVQQHAIFEQ